MTKIPAFPTKIKQDESLSSDPKPRFQKPRIHKILKHCVLQTIEKYFGHSCGYQKKVYFCSLKFKEKIRRKKIEQ